MQRIVAIMQQVWPGRKSFPGDFPQKAKRILEHDVKKREAAFR